MSFYRFQVLDILHESVKKIHIRISNFIEQTVYDNYKMKTVWSKEDRAPVREGNE